MEKNNEEIKIDYDRINKVLDRLEKLEIKVNKLEHEHEEPKSNNKNKPKEPFNFENSKAFNIMEEHGVFKDLDKKEIKPFDYENSREHKIFEEYGVYDKENDKQIETEPLWIKEWKKHKKQKNED